MKTTTATAAPRFSRASRSSSRIARIDIGRSLASITTRRSQPRATRASRVSTKSPFFDFMQRAGLGPGPVEQVAGAAGEVGEHRLEQVLEVAALGRGPGAFGAAGGGGRLDRDQALLERA